MSRADPKSPRRVNDSDRADDIRKIGQRLAHPHENDIVDSFAGCFLHRQQLLHDLAYIQISRETFEPARAEFAAVSAAHLGRNAERPPVRAFAIQGGGGGNKHGLDQVPVGETEEKLLRRIFGAQHANGLEVAEGEVTGEEIAQALGKIGHLVERGCSFFIEPINDLLCAVGTLVPGRQPGLDLVEKERVDGWFVGRWHD